MQSPREILDSQGVNEIRKEKTPYDLVDWHRHFAVACYQPLTPWCRVFFDTLVVPHLVKKFPVFYVTQRYITTFTTAPSFSLYLVQSSRRPPKISILILSSHPRLGLPSVLLPSNFSTKTPHAPLLSPLLATFPAHHWFNQLDIWCVTQIFKFFSRNFLQSPITSSILDPNIFLSAPHWTPSSNITPSAGDQVSTNAVIHNY